MKKIIITLITTLLVFITALIITDNYVTEQLILGSDRRIANTLDNFSDDLDDDLLLTQNTTYGFLTGIFSKELPGASDFVCVDHTSKQFVNVELQKRLESFLKANPCYNRAMFILQTDSTKPLSKASFYAPMLEQGGSSLVNVAEDYDFSQSKSLNLVRSTLKSFWSLPSRESPVASKIITYYVPLCRQSDRSFLGAFVVSIDISTLDKKLEHHVPYPDGQSEMMVVNNDGNVISSYPTSYKEFQTSHTVDYNLRKKGKTYIKDSHHDRRTFTYEGEKYFQYERSLKNAPWKVITICKSKAVYAKPRQVGSIVLLTSLISTIFMLVGFFIISYMIFRLHQARLSAQQELSMAAKVQDSVLRPMQYETKVSPSLGGGTLSLHSFMRPAREAGGDLYDYAEVDGKLIICIGDVSGKGMPAALFMTQVISLFRSAVKRSTEPSFIVSSINDVLAENNPDMTFCTLFVATLQGSELTYCNAGHNPPLLLADKTPRFMPIASNMPVGVMEGSPYSSEQLTLHHDDSLLLYTDGVTEAKDKKNRLYGEQLMVTALQERNSNEPEYCNSLLTSSLSQFVGSAEQSDDITILTINYKQ